MKKNQSIEEKVIERLLGNSYPEDLLESLCVLEEHTLRMNYTDEELIQYIPFLRGTDLKISSIQKIRKNLREQLIETINAFAEWDMGTTYEIAVLIYAVQNISYKSEKGKGIHKRNKRISFCYDYVDMVTSLCEIAKIRKFIQYLKLFD